MFSEEKLSLLNNTNGLLLNQNNKNLSKIYQYSRYKENSNLIKFYETEDTFWVTNLNDGIHIFDKRINQNQPQIILKNIETTRAFIDFEKNIWVGSQSNGVFLFPNIHIEGIRFENVKQNDFHCVSIFNNNIVAGNEYGEVMIFDRYSLAKKGNLKLDKYPRRVRHLKSFKNSLYILGDYNVHKLDSDLNLHEVKHMSDADFKASELKNFKQLAILKDSIYTANSNGIAAIHRRSNKVNRIWNKRSTSIYKTNNDSIWIGTTSGLYLKSFNNIEQKKLDSLFDSSIIYDIRCSKNGLLLASNSRGLGVLKDSSFISLTKKDGLLSNFIKSIYVDKKEQIWLSSNLGLNKLELNTDNSVKKITSYTTSDGLYSNNVRGCIVDEELNKVYVATSNGLNIIDLTKENTIIQPPLIHLNEVLLNNISVEKNNQVFNHNSNNFQFSYSGLSFKSLGNIKFKYRLKGLEEEWIETNNTSIRYSSLRPNNYTFEVKSIAKNDIESQETTTYSFKIRPPIYDTWWFKSLALISIIGLVYFYFQRRNLKQKRALKVKEQISSLRYQALNAQMNPHFINNLIVNIDDLLKQANHQKVGAAIHDFGKLINHILQSTKQNLIPLSDEIEIVSSYISLQNIRFRNAIKLQLNKDRISNHDFENIFVPPMIIQPIVENSIKHGFTDSTKKYTITIDFEIENNDYIVCKIIDNGSGLKEVYENSRGISIKNINQRLQLISENSKTENFISITNNKNEINTLVGTKVTLKIPLISF